ncbi:hypothetical protein BDZ89DRAFT_1065782 [Hymenopellis radicata]|nr:hypothetical protein BDZ89DRAFT_1065782 [Hymenopellis radicata]
MVVVVATAVVVVVVAVQRVVVVAAVAVIVDQVEVNVFIATWPHSRHILAAFPASSPHSLHPRHRCIVIVIRSS